MRKKFIWLPLLTLIAILTFAWAPGLSSANVIANDDPGFAIADNYKIAIDTATIGQAIAIADTDIVTATSAGMRSDTPILAPDRYATGHQNHRFDMTPNYLVSNNIDLTAGANMSDTTAPTTSIATFRIRT